MRNFDKIAPFYDWLASVVFFGRIKKSQTDLINAHSPTGKVLVIGGGTGWILPQLLSGNMIDQLIYIEQSRSMLEKARKSCPEHHLAKVQFIHGDEHSLPSGPYDAIFTHFFLDCFELHHLKVVMSSLSASLSSKGHWYFVDFRIDTRWRRALWQIPLTWLMIRFFRFAVNLESKRLVNFDPLFEGLGYWPIWEKMYAGKFIQSVIYQKP